MTGPMSGSEGMLTFLLGSLSPAPFTAMHDIDIAFGNRCFFLKDIIRFCGFSHTCIEYSNIGLSYSHHIGRNPRNFEKCIGGFNGYIFWG